MDDRGRISRKVVAYDNQQVQQLQEIIENAHEDGGERSPEGEPAKQK